MRTIAVAAVVIFAAAGWASAQGLSADQVAEGFTEGVVDFCAQSHLRGMAIGDWPEDQRVGVAPASEENRGIAGRDIEGPVWDVLSAQGIVVISESPDGGCNVVAYGPPVRSTFDAITQGLTDDLGFERQDDGGRRARDRVFTRTIDGREVRVALTGTEPGMPGHTFRFSVISAFVSSQPPF